MAVIADTGALIALANAEDRYHKTVKQFFATNRDPVIIPCPVVPETCFILRTSMGVAAELEFLRSIRGHLMLEHYTVADAARVIEINDKYGDAELGFVDATVMAMAERLNIQTVLTVDHRDFSMFRPTHCAAFRLIPERLRRR